MRTNSIPILLALVVVASSPRQALAQSPGEFKACMERCEEVFVKVSDSDTSCVVTLRKIQEDLAVIAGLLGDSSLCKGRYREACEYWQQETNNSLGKLSALLANVDDCRRVPVDELKKYMPPLDPIKACKGDGEYTDIHDYLGSNQKRVDEMANVKTNYTYSLVRMDMADDLAGHRPNCSFGLKEAAYYVEPVFHFLLALESLEPYQNCAATCVEPTEDQRRLWRARELLEQHEKKAADLRAGFNQQVVLRKERLGGEALDHLACSAFTEMGEKLSGIEAEFVKIRENLINMLAGAEAPADIMDIIGVSLNSLSSRLGDLKLADAVSICEKEDRLLVELEGRRREVIERVNRGKTLGLEAYDTFDREGAAGDECEWILDCNIALLCDHGRCGPQLDPGIAGLMAEARDLSSSAVDLTLHGKNGLDPMAEKTIEALEKRLTRIEKDLTEAGWQEALKKWNSAIDRELKDKVGTLSTEIKEQLDSLHDLSTSAISPRECRKNLRQLDDVMDNLSTGVQALKTADPIANPKWSSVQFGKIQDALGEVDKVREACDTACLAQQEDESSFLIYILLGLGVLVLGVGAFIFISRMRRN